MITLNECPLCGASSFKNVYRAPYFRGDQEKFQIQECQNCQLWVTNPRPADEELGAYYDPANYISHNNQSKGLVDKLYQVVRTYSLRKKVSLINSLHSNPGKLLDYGAGTGHFIKQAAKAEWQVQGVEPSPEARGVAMSSHNLELASPEDFQWPAQDYDVISLWHVLEHLPNLQKHLAQFSKALKKGGTLIIAVPNHESADAEHYGESWAALDVPLHLYHFKKKNIKQLAEQHDLKLEQVKNMPFDSFYVSMLSEKIAGGRNNHLAAVKQGLSSNLKGFKEKNASSLIYILRKPQ